MHKFLSSSLSPFPPSPLSAWKSHTGYYNCSMYEEKGEDQEVNVARKALEKYLFYYQRVGREGGRKGGRKGGRDERKGGREGGRRGREGGRDERKGGTRGREGG